MSWDKNTIVLSEIDSAIRVLKNLGSSYELIVLGKMRGYGLNDSESEEYPIRRLEYANVVLLERMIRNNDCDMDDVVVSYTFNKIDEPLNWSIEETGESKEDFPYVS